VLDACAAPGGKTAHLLELEPTLELTALDSDRERLVRLRENLARLRLQEAAPAQRQGQPSVQPQVLVGDAADPKLGWWDGRPFDAILVDAPCSASGIVRRHPDIVWLRRESDIAALAATQARMLDNLWPLLAPGGVLVYATCSVFKAEGAQQIDAFMQRQTNDPPTLDPASPGHLRPLPDNRPSGGAAGALTTQAPDPFSTHHEPGATHDGFYYARLVKRR
jgi:16S rRNA (cytosine967-C5)-methyltransferase